MNNFEWLKIPKPTLFSPEIPCITLFYKLYFIEFPQLLGMVWYIPPTRGLYGMAYEGLAWDACVLHEMALVDIELYWMLSNCIG